MLNISSYTSQNNPTSSSSTMDIPSSPPSSSYSTFIAGGRALDRHNPIITDEKRSGINSNPNTPIGTPRTIYVLQQKPKTPTIFYTPNNNFISQPNSPISTFHNNNNNKRTNKKSFLKTNKNTTNNTTVPELGFTINSNISNNSNNKNYDENYDNNVRTEIQENIVSPPESSRYLLDDTSFLDVLSGFDPVLKLDPNNNASDSNHVDEVSGFDNESAKPSEVSTNSPGSSDQVVMLRVLLHCRGCERKIKKLLSRLSGVTSFDIDFAAKKITVIGDVTPVQVLSIISKVKTVKLLSPTIPSSNVSLINTTNINS